MKPHWYETPCGRQRAAEILNLRAAGLKQQEIADKVGLHIASVSRYLKDLKEWDIEPEDMASGD